ncbi:hypothetical protein Tco_1283907 [Tanacetum coccineum]
MNTAATQQVALDNSLVAPEKRLKIEKCNARIAFSKPQREETYQVTLEALKLSPCYPAFVITAEVLKIYMHQFWTTIKKIINSDAYNFKLEKKKFRVDTENVDYVALLWEDFMYQADNREISSARKEHMPYPRFTKVIINHFIYKDKTISMRNQINFHTIRDDSLLGTLKFVFKTQDYQQYGALISDDMINQDIKDSNAYKTYYEFATRKVPPMKARKYKKVASPLRKLSLVKEVEPVKKTKRKAHAKADRSKDIEILYDGALSKAAELKEATKRSKKDYHISQASGSGVPDVPTYDSESENESWGDSEDDHDDDSKGDNDKANSNDDGNFNADDNERTDSDDDDENPSFTLKDYDEEEHEEGYESDDDYKNMLEEEDDDLYKDVNVRSLEAEHEKERKGDEEMTNADQNVSQEKSYEQVIEDAHATLTSSQKTESSKQSSSVSSDFASKFLILENVPPAVDEVASIMNVKSHQEESSTLSFHCTWDKELSQLKQADHSAQLLESAKSQIPTIVDDLLSIRIRYATRIALQSYTKEFEKKAQEERKLNIDVVEKSIKDIIKDKSTINESLENVILAKSSSQPKSTYEATTSLTEFELKKNLLDKIEKSKSYQAAPEHRELYDGLVKSYNLDKDLFSSYGNVYSLKRDREDKDKDEDPPAGSNQGLKKRKMSKDAKPPKGSKSKESKTSSSKGIKSQPKSSGNLMQKQNKPLFESCRHPNATRTRRPPYPDPDWNATKSIDSIPPQKWISKITQVEKPPLTFDELMSNIGDILPPKSIKYLMLSRSRKDKDKDEDPPARSDQGSSKGSKSQPKSSGKSVQAEEPVFEIADTKMPQDQGGDTEDQPNVKATPMNDWFKKPDRPPTPDPDWNATKSFDSRPPQKWLGKIAQAEKPPLTFDEMMSTPIDFSAYVMHNLKIDNLTQEILVGPAFNLLKGTCKSFVELEYHFEECYKVVTDQLDWNNLEGHEYPFYLSKPLPLIEAQGRQVIPADYFFNNDLEYLKGRSSSRKYTTSTTKNKAVKYDNIEGIEEMVLMLWNPWYNYGYFEEIIVRREDQKLYKFKEGDFPILNLRDIEDLMLLLVQKKLSNLEKDVIFDLNVALRMFTRCIVILKRVEDLQLGVESYQKKLNITKPETFRFDISKLTPYTAYKNPQGIIYQDKLKRNRLMRSDELYKFCDGTLTSVRRVLCDIASSLSMDYLPKRRWSNLDRKRSRIMIKAIDQ